MDLWRGRWRPRRSAGPVGRRRAGVTALVLLAVTAALVVLLAVVFHLGVAAAVVGIVGILATVPSAYLAWAALPAIKVPVRGRVAGLQEAVAPGQDGGEQPDGAGAALGHQPGRGQGAHPGAAQVGRTELGDVKRHISLWDRRPGRNARCLQASPGHRTPPRSPRSLPRNVPLS
jgi:hypothetical protein